MIETLKDSASWQRLESKVRDGTANDNQRGLFASRIQSVKNLQDQVDYLHSINNKASLNFGQCKIASGFRKAYLANSDEGVKGSYALDWAVGEVSRERIGGNLVSKTSDLLYATYAEYLYSCPPKMHWTKWVVWKDSHSMAKPIVPASAPCTPV